MAFVATCIESAARLLGVDYREVYISPVKALKLFYRSQTCADLHNKATGLYLFGDLYIAEEFVREMEGRQ